MADTPLVPKWFSDAVAQPARSASVVVEDCPIHYRSWGDPSRPPLVLVHGGAAHSHWWSFLAPLLTDRYYVIAPDLSGHGDSGRRAHYPRSIWATELIGVIDHAQLATPPVVIGHSMGGLVTIITASLYGSRLAGAIAVDAPVRRPDPESDPNQRGKSFRNPKTYPDLESALARFRLVPEQPCENDFILRYIAQHSVRAVAGGYTWKFDATAFEGAPTDSMADYMSSLRCRFALIIGQKSAVVPPEAAEYMYELVQRSAPLVEIPEAYHHLLLDQPIAFIASVRALLADWEHSTPRTPAAG
jgi:pimeloyl-ACP methyl ester carboxylesterase